MPDASETFAPVLDHFQDTARHPRGPYNALTDVRGVKVGHVTLRDGDLNTGVTAIVPHDGNVFREKVVAASHVVNGFGKSVGLAQIDELGELETPILLTNTLSVPACSEALIRHAIEANPDIGRTTSTVNPVVGECNDGPLNDIQAMAITSSMALSALSSARSGAVEQGSVGAGTGMTCFGFKGGIGTSSRKLRLNGVDYTLGALVLANFGKPGDLVLPDGRRATPSDTHDTTLEKGSVIVVLATDVPLEARQLKRVCKRGGAGLARLGSYWGNGSGDFVVGFTTACRREHDSKDAIVSMQRLNEDYIDILFEATAETTAEAVLNSMLGAEDFALGDAIIRKSLRAQL